MAGIASRYGIALFLGLAACAPSPAKSPPLQTVAAADTAPTTPEPSPTTPVDGLAALRRIAAQSQCARHRWDHGRGVAPTSYVEGVTLVFVRAVCHPDRAEVQAVSAPAATGPGADDALAVYAARFKAAGMTNDRAGVDTLRHAYVLLIGLGMMESSGRYCEGRDVSECFTTADSAEAGPFQTSYGARRQSPALQPLIERYSTDPGGCLLDTFRGNITCRIVKSHDPECPDATSDVAGTGPGADWQRLTKICPAFATEYAAVVLRTHGGPKGEFNPIRKQQAELLPECDDMLKTAQVYVAQHREVCSAL